MVIPPPSLDLEIEEIALGRDALGGWSTLAIAGARGEAKRREVLVSGVDGRLHLVLPEIEGRVTGLEWSPRGDLLAFVVDGPEPTGQMRSVVWASPHGGERGRVRGGALAWAPGGRSLLVADIEAGALRRIPVDDPRGAAAAEDIASFHDDGALAYPPRIAISADGQRVAWSCRDGAQDRVSVAFAERRGGAPTLVTEIPGADAFVLPFWSPRGNTLGLVVSHVGLGRSAVVLWGQLRGQGMAIRTAATLDAPFRPAWSARFGVAMTAGDATWRGLGELDARGFPMLPPQRAIFIDPARGSSIPVPGEPAVTGHARFVATAAGEALVLDGTAHAACVPLPPRSSNACSVPGRPDLDFDNGAFA